MSRRAAVKVLRAETLWQDIVLAASVAALSLLAKIRLFALPLPLPCCLAMTFSTTFVAFIIPPLCSVLTYHFHADTVHPVLCIHTHDITIPHLEWLP